MSHLVNLYVHNINITVTSVKKNCTFQCTIIAPGEISLMPERGSVLGGTPIVVTGPGLARAENVTCCFNGVVCAGAVIPHQDEVLCISPPSDTSGPVDFEIFYNSVSFGNSNFTYGKIIIIMAYQESFI